MQNMILVPITKRMDIIMSIYVGLISWINLMIRKMVERKAFLTKSKHQYCTSQWGEHDCSAHNKKYGDYFENPSLNHSRKNFDYKENGEKKSFSCKSKASISCIPMWRTWVAVPVAKRMEIIVSKQVHPILRMNINYKENGEKKSFLAKPKN